MTARSFPFEFLTDGTTRYQITQSDLLLLLALQSKTQFIAGIDDLGWYGTMAGRTGNEPNAMGLTAPGGAMTLRVGQGRALVAGTVCDIDSAGYDVTFADNATGSSRIDRVVIRRDPSTYRTRPHVLTGTPGAGQPPAVTQNLTGTYDLLAYQVLVPAGATSASGGQASKHVDERTFLGYRQAWDFNATTFETSAREFSPRPDVTVRVYVPPSGELRVDMTARLENTSVDGYSYWGYSMRKGLDTEGGTVVQIATESHAAMKRGTTVVTCARSVLLRNLEPGLYTLIGEVRSRAAGTATAHDPSLIATPMP